MRTVAVVGNAKGQTLAHFARISALRIIVVRKRARRPDEAGVDVFSIHDKEWQDFARHQEVRLLHGYQGPAAIRAASLSLRLQIPLVASFHGADLSSHLSDRSYRKQLNAVFARASRVIAVCEDLKTRLLKLGCPAEKGIVWRRGVDLKMFSYQPCTQPEGDEPLHIISVGRLKQKKGMDQLIRGFARLLVYHSRARLTIVGDGKERQHLSLLTKSLGLSRYVHFTGELPFDQVREYLSRAHLFALPCRTAPNGDREGVPRALLEAMACGLPVITTDHAGIPEVVHHGCNGYLVREGDVNALTRGLVHLASRPDSWPRLGRAARAWVEQHGELNRQMTVLGALYESALVEG